MPIIHNENKYLINANGTFRRVDRFWSNDTISAASIILNNGWQDGLLPEVNKKFPFIEVYMIPAGFTNGGPNLVQYNDWTLMLLVKNAEMDLIKNQINIPDSYLTFIVKDPTGNEKQFSVNPSIEAISQHYAEFVEMAKTKSIETSTVELSVKGIEKQVRELNSAVEKLKSAINLD